MKITIEIEPKEIADVADSLEEQASQALRMSESLDKAAKKSEEKAKAIPQNNMVCERQKTNCMAMYQLSGAWQKILPRFAYN